jgi:hypothetical protein
MPQERPSTSEAIEEVELIQCIYMSAAAEAMDSDALRTLLAKARRNNERSGLSGMLLYAGGSFFQVLEGPARAVDAVYRRIQADPRHDSIVLLVREPIKERSFEDWTMGFYQASADEAGSLPGLNDFLCAHPSAADETASGRARELLDAFRRGRWRRKINA